MTGEEFSTFCAGLNGGHTIDATLLFQFGNIGRGILEEEREWVVLRKTNTALSVTASSGSAWNTAIAMTTTITDFRNFYGDAPIKIWNGVNYEEYHRVPFEDRLLYKDSNNTFCFDDNSGNLYLNGIVTMSGSLYICYESDSGDFTVDSPNIWSKFPTKYHPILGFYAVGIYKGAVDWDDIVKLQLPGNAAALGALKDALISWDDKKQLQNTENIDYANRGDYGFRANAISMN